MENKTAQIESATHTPGEWTACDSPITFGDATGLPILDNVAGSECIVALVLPNRTGKGQHQRANQKLIAIAPKLLATLRRLVSQVESAEEGFAEHGQPLSSNCVEMIEARKLLLDT